MASMAKKTWMLVLVLALGCGLRTPFGGEDGTDTGDDGSTGDTGTSDGGDTDDGGTSDDCEGFDDEDGEASQTVIRVENTGAETLFLGGLWSCDFARMVVVPTDATDDTHWPLRKCEFSCEAVLGPDGVGCDSSCPIANVIMIEPGGAFEDPWPGDMHYPAVPPEHCCPADGCYGPCLIRRPAPDGEYEATVNVFTEVSCAVGDCDCTPNADGWCEIEGFAETFPEDGKLASVAFVYPVDEAILSVP
jgi:hypothetical protein